MRLRLWLAASLILVLAISLSPQTQHDRMLVRGQVALSGSTSGSTAIVAQSTASGTLTAPSATDTLVGKNTTDTLTNKTIDTAGPNTIKINGNTLSASAGTGTVSVPNSTDTLVGRATTDTLTGKTLDADGTGNIISIQEKRYYRAARCTTTTPTADSEYDFPPTNAPSAVCGGTTPRWAALQYNDGASEITADLNLRLPSDWTVTGGIDIAFIWDSASTSTNSVVWTVRSLCVADAEDLNTNTYNTVQTVADANNAVASTRNSASITGVTTTGCAAGESLFLRIGRDPTNGSDTLVANVFLLGVELTYRRAM